MKINIRKLPYERVMALPRPKHRNPLRPLGLLKPVIRIASLPTLLKTRFSFTQERMELVGNQPCLILMNHSSFTDLKIVHRIFPGSLSIVSTMDSLVGMPWLLRLVGCIPTQKFVSDLTLIRDMNYALKTCKSSVVLFPEASYTLDGRGMALPRGLGVLLKRFKVPVVMVTTWGAFARDPLYNGLQKRRVKVSAHVKCLLTPEEIGDKSINELDAIIGEAFTFDQFAWQRDNRVIIDESFRADGLHRVLYHCPDCGTIGRMEGKGIRLTCHACGKVHGMNVYGQLMALEGETRFPHIPDWFDWQRTQVEQEVSAGTYRLDVPVRIAMLVDYKALYMVGEGRLVHDESGFRLTGCDGKLDYQQANTACHSLNVDYYWYEIGDMISIGNRDALYYCFPQDGTSVTRARLAAEAFYRLQKA